jgi:hypothetical protein
MDQYDQLEVIGTGAFGKVTKIKRRSDAKVMNCLEPSIHRRCSHTTADIGMERIELWQHE